MTPPATEIEFRLPRVLRVANRPATVSGMPAPLVRSAPPTTPRRVRLPVVRATLQPADAAAPATTHMMMAAPTDVTGQSTRDPGSGSNRPSCPIGNAAVTNPATTA